MSRRGTAHLAQDLTQLINRYRQEYEMTLAEVVGVLEVIKQELIDERIRDKDEEPE